MDALLKTMEQLDYPYRLTKSTFVSLTQTSLPIALGVLDWLVWYLKIKEDAEFYEDTCLIMF